MSDQEAYPKVVINGVPWKPESELDNEVRALLNEVYGALWTEAYYDPYNKSTQEFARPLAEKMTRLNKLLHFKQ